MCRIFSLSVAFFSMCLINGIVAREAEPTIIVTSIPKSGTHLLTRTLELITGKSHRWIKWNKKSLRDEVVDPPKEIIVSHFHCDEDINKILSNPEVITFFIYRDPRDLLISYVHFELKHRPNQYANKSVETLLPEFIKGTHGYQHFRTARGFDSFYRSYITWKDSPNVCALRFEDLIGPLGGGSEASQLNTIRRITEHLGYSWSEETLRDIAANIFGHATTFRAGQIGDWKSTFTKRDIDLFKEEAGELLIELGYEDHEDW